MKQRDELIDRLGRAQADFKMRLQATVTPVMQAELGDMGGVTLHQHEVMRRLLGGAEMTMHELAAAAGIGPSAATQLVDRLERRGLVVRTRDGDDRRVQRVIPTELAKTVQRRFRTCMTRALAEAVVVLDDDELRAYVELSERVARGAAVGQKEQRRSA